VIGDDQIAAICVSSALNRSHKVQTVATLAAAVPRLQVLERAIVVMNLDVADGDDVQRLCAAAKAAGRAFLVLACTSDVRRVPPALKAGCDSVLMKPFAPNLLYARLGRLTRDLQIRALSPRATLRVGTNHDWPALVCPACHHEGAVSFDATSLRRAWYACLSCDHVWIARRQS
jgi:DNA-binding response OmpR family regulator